MLGLAFWIPSLPQISEEPALPSDPLLASFASLRGFTLRPRLCRGLGVPPSNHNAGRERVGVAGAGVDGASDAGSASASCAAASAGSAGSRGSTAAWMGAGKASRKSASTSSGKSGGLFCACGGAPPRKQASMSSGKRNFTSELGRVFCEASGAEAGKRHRYRPMEEMAKQLDLRAGSLKREHVRATELNMHRALTASMHSTAAHTSRRLAFRSGAGSPGNVVAKLLATKPLNPKPRPTFKPSTPPKP